MFLTSLLLTFSSTSLGQDVVPPVKKSAGSGAMTITPDPNDSLSGKSRTKANTSTISTGDTLRSIKTGRGKAISIIIDHSGSMHGEPLNAAKRSSAIVIDLIKIWGQADLFPDEIGNIQFQYIQFGGQGQQNVLHPLRRISDIDQLRNDILNSVTRYSNTDFTSGLEPAVRAIPDSLDHKTIFLTDALDQGKGPNRAKGYYNSLDEIKFIIYGSSRDSVKQKGWLSILNDADEYHVNDEYEVFALFVKTLFEFVDNINKYLVRQGEQRIDINKPFSLSKHSASQSHLSILSLPKEAIGLKIRSITDALGNILDPSQYKLYPASTFLNIVLKPSVPSGDYKVNFESNSISRSHKIQYINFEKANIQLKLFTNQNKGNSCFLENSSVNFDFKYWDLDQNVEVSYPDFLSHSAYRYKMFNDIIDETGSGNNGLLFSHSFSFGSAGSYEIRSSWSYNEQKLKNDDPPLSIVENICVSKNGSLVHLEYDTTNTWQGREILFTAILADSNPSINKQNRKLILDIGSRDEIELVQDPSNNQHYQGTLENVERGRDYTLSLKNINPNYNFALDASSITTFYGRERTLQITFEGKDFSGLKENYDPDSFLDRLRYAFSPSASELPDSSYTYIGDELIVPYELPYYSSLSDEVKFEISINKVFQDETLDLNFIIDSNSQNYPHSDVKLIYPQFFPFTSMGWPKFSREYENAVTFQFPEQTGSSTGTGSVTNSLKIQKREGGMDIQAPLYPEPSFTARANLIFTKSNGTIQKIIVPDNVTIIEVKTNQLDKMATRLRWWAMRIIMFFVSGLLLLLYLIPLYFSIRKSRQKVRQWRRILDNDHLKPQDLWNSPEKNQKCNPQIALPEVIKSSFVDDHGILSKNEFDSWIKETIILDNQDPKKANRFITKRIGYQSIFEKSKVPGKILYIILSPILILVDVWRASLEVDKRIIKNTKLIEYVKTVEDINIPNIPSTFSLSNQNMINVTFNDKADNAIRLRYIRAQGKVVEIVIHTDDISVHSKNYTLNLLWSNGENSFAGYNERIRSPRGINEFEIEVEERLFIRVTDIDYEQKACIISVNRL